MNSRLDYEEIRKLLLEDDNINEVSVDQKKRIIKLKPIDTEYVFLEEPLKNFMYKFSITIGGRTFGIKQSVCNYKRIYELTLKEMYIDYFDR